MTEDRRRKADLLLDIHEFEEAKKEFDRELFSLKQDVMRVQDYLNSNSKENVHSWIDNYPTKERFLEITQRRTELEETEQRLNAEREKFSL